MTRASGLRFLLSLAAAAYVCSAEEVVLDFENAVPLLADGQANRVAQWEEKGVVFTLAHEPKQTKGKGMLMFFIHLATGHKGIVSAMATESIPVRATFPKPVSSVTISFWGSTGTPALLQAFNASGSVVDRASVPSVPGRKAPGDSVPFFTMTVKGSIAYIQFSGPREGEYLAADEVRFTPLAEDVVRKNSVQASGAPTRTCKIRLLSHHGHTGEVFRWARRTGDHEARDVRRHQERGAIGFRRIIVAQGLSTCCSRT